ncbi:histidine phosphatase family protein [Candidimonas sp. SYP-B2681]|nr:histidine phosphatase family protein [Candidimonas sp. SYP-B2681]
MTHFWLIRHGETQWNAAKRLQGWIDIPLSPIGLKQARQLADYLRSPSFGVPIDVVVSSDLGRAVETARIATTHLGLPIEAIPDLRERSYGIYEGKDWATLDIMRTRGNGIDFRNPQQLIDQGEALHAFDVRISDAFENLAQRYPGKNILAFAHGGVIDIAWRRVEQLPLDAPRAHPILNASINQFSIDSDLQWKLTDWGQVEHLENAAQDDII